MRTCLRKKWLAITLWSITSWLPIEVVANPLSPCRVTCTLAIAQTLWVDESRDSFKLDSWHPLHFNTFQSVAKQNTTLICKFDRLSMYSPSRRIPIFRHFLNRQYWHWFLWCWSMGQLRLPRHEYVRLRRTDRLKKDLQPADKRREGHVKFRRRTSLLQELPSGKLESALR